MTDASRIFRSKELTDRMDAATIESLPSEDVEGQSGLDSLEVIVAQLAEDVSELKGDLSHLDSKVDRVLELSLGVERLLATILTGSGGSQPEAGLAGEG
jgi:hypothetical protein